MMPANNILRLPSSTGDMPPDTMSALALATETGASYRQIDYWIRTGLLVSHQVAAGSGHPRAVPKTEVQVVRLVLALLRSLGAGPRQAFESARVLLEGGTLAVPVGDDATLVVAVDEP